MSLTLKPIASHSETINSPVASTGLFMEMCVIRMKRVVGFLCGETCAAVTVDRSRVYSIAQWRQKRKRFRTRGGERLCYAAYCGIFEQIVESSFDFYPPIAKSSDAER